MRPVATVPDLASRQVSILGVDLNSALASIGRDAAAISIVAPRHATRPAAALRSRTVEGARPRPAHPAPWPVSQQQLGAGRSGAVASGGLRRRLLPERDHDTQSRGRRSGECHGIARVLVAAADFCSSATPRRSAGSRTTSTFAIPTERFTPAQRSARARQLTGRKSIQRAAEEIRSIVIPPRQRRRRAGGFDRRAEAAASTPASRSSSSSRSASKSARELSPGGSRGSPARRRTCCSSAPVTRATAVISRSGTALRRGAAPR